MKNALRRLLSVWLCLVLATGTAAVGGKGIADVLSVTAAAETIGGTCGDNLTWEFDAQTGTLTISGSGAMENCTPENTPWYVYRSSIITVDIKDGVTSIGNSAFSNCTSLKNVTIPDGVTDIEQHAFSNCDELVSIAIPEGVTKLWDEAFADCENLETIVLPSTLTEIDGKSVFAGSCLKKDVIFNGTYAQWRAIEDTWAVFRYGGKLIIGGQTVQYD